MKLTRLIAIFLGGCWAGHLSAAITHDPSLTWHTLQTPHFNIHYHDPLQPIAKQAAAISEQVYQQLTKRFNWIPQQPTEVIINDRIDVANGSATMFPYNVMNLIVTAPDDPALADRASWLELVITHEYTHILHLDKALGSPQSLRRILGRWLALFPAAYQPRWLLEGLATYVETDRGRGIGRGQSSYFDMLMRTEVIQGIKPIRQINQPLASWPSGTTTYLYGSYFYQFVRDRYGQAKVLQLIDHYSHNLIPFRINNNTWKVLGKDLPELWQEFEQYLQTKFATQIQQVNANPLSTITDITTNGYLKSQLRITQSGHLYYIQTDASSDPALMQLAPGPNSPTWLTTLNPAARFAIHAQSGIMIAQPEINNNTNLWYDLYRFDPTTGKTQRLTHNSRYRYIAWHPQGHQLIAVHNAQGQQALHLLNANGQYQSTWWQGNQQESINDIDWSPDGTSLIASLWRPQTGWNLEQFNIQTKQWQALTQSIAIELNPQFSADGRTIIYSADYGGIYNIQQLELATGQISTLTNVLGGAFHPTLTPNGELYFANYTPNGFNIAHQRTTTEHWPTPTRITGPSALFQPPPPVQSQWNIQPYDPFASLPPTWWLPDFLGLIVLPDARRLGFLTSGNDVLQRHNYSAAFHYDIDNKLAGGALTYRYDGWQPVLQLGLSRNHSPNYKTINDTLTLVRIKQEDTLAAEILFPWLSIKQRWFAGLGLIKRKARFLFVDNTDNQVTTLNDNVIGIGLGFDSLRTYSRSISPSHGRLVTLAAENTQLIASDRTGQILSLDWREHIALFNQHVLSLRAVGGFGIGEPRPFQLGGELTDASSTSTLTLFDKRRFTLRGYPTGLTKLRGRRMALFSTEWRFPISLIERGIMAPPIGIHQFSGRIFADAASVWHSGYQLSEAIYYGAGIELMTELVIGYLLPLTLRIGYAHGFNEGGEDRPYLQIGTSF